MVLNAIARHHYFPSPQTNEEYDPRRCFAFVHDLSDEAAAFPVPEGSLDVVVLIFVLSALRPDRSVPSLVCLFSRMVLHACALVILLNTLQRDHEAYPTMQQAQGRGHPGWDHSHGSN